MSKVVISKKKRDQIETLLYAGIGAVAMTVSMADGKTTDGTIMIRDNIIKQILDILDNNTPS